MIKIFLHGRKRLLCTPGIYNDTIKNNIALSVDSDLIDNERIIELSN